MSVMSFIATLVLIYLVVDDIDAFINRRYKR